MPDLLERLRSAISDRYAVKCEIGRGGMATVYLAEDARHRRQVAIKVLHPELAAAVGADRFLQEIEIVAGLNHAHILPLFDSGEAIGLLYYIMPYVEGESLLERMERESPLPADVAVRIASEVADGLGYAHQRGIVHRDVKPGNILLSGQHAYITDFGIARAFDTAAGGTLTETGIAVGTPMYMSPEQAAGEREIDERSDVYALGCVLYEMLSGEPPFTGATPQAVMVQRLTEDARPIRQIRHDVSPGVEKALSRALERQPDDRFSTCEQFGRSLVPAGGLMRRSGSFVRRLRFNTRSRLLGRPALASAMGAMALGLVIFAGWLAVRASGMSFGTGPPAISESTVTSDMARVAILYFEDLSEDRSLQSYAAGFTKGLIRRVNAVAGLSAPSYTAIRQFRDSSVSPGALASALQVDYLAEGAVLPTVNGLQVEIDLVDPATGLQVETVRQQAPLANLTDLLETVADSLALALRPELGEQVRRRRLRAETSSDEALDLVWRADALRGESAQLMELDMPNRDGAETLLMRADSLLTDSEGMDPAWAEPSIQRGWIAHDRAMIFTDVPKEYGLGRLGLAQEGLGHANRALGLNADDPAGLELRGTIGYGLAKREQSDASRDLLLASAEADLRASVAADPGRATTWRILGDLLSSYAPDFEGARQAFKRALEVDRFLDGAQDLTVDLIGLSTDLEQYDEAWRWMVDGRRRWPEDVTFPYTAILIMASRHTEGDVERAWAYWDTVQYTWPYDRKDQYLPVVYADIAAVLGLAGREDSAHAVLERGITATSDSSFHAYNVAHAYLTLGDVGASLQWLAIDLKADPGKKAKRAIEPWFRALHGNPDFETLVQVKSDSED